MLVEEIATSRGLRTPERIQRILERQLLLNKVIDMQQASIASLNVKLDGTMEHLDDLLKTSSGNFHREIYIK